MVTLHCLERDTGCWLEEGAWRVCDQSWGLVVDVKLVGHGFGSDSYSLNEGKVLEPKHRFWG